MKRFFGIIATISILMLSTNASYSAEPQVQAGSKSIFWNFHGLSDLGVENSSVGMQYLFADRIGAWGEIKLGTFNYKADADDDDGEATTDFALAGGAIFYLFKNDPVALFVSPLFWLESSSYEDKDASSTYIDSEMTFSVGASIGAEWWFAKNVSFSAETYLGLVSTSMTRERGDNESNSSVFGIGTNTGYGSNFSISFYF